MSEKLEFNPNKDEKPSQETPESLESIERKEKRIEVIQDIRERYGILFISVQPREVTRQIGLQDDHEWFRDALGFQAEPGKLKTIYALEGNLPDTVDEAGIIVGGSVHSTYENLSWIRKLEEFLKIIHQRNKPILGVCFGHQLIAQAFGGRVEKNPLGREFGDVNIDLTQEGALDPLFEGIPLQFRAAESHQDVITKLPELEKSAVLARNDLTAQQALSYGETTRTIQFHPEITSDILKKVGEFRKDALIQSGYFKNEQEFYEFIKGLQDTPAAKQILKNFDRNFVLGYHLKNKGK